MCLCNDHNGIHSEIQERTSRHIRTVIRQAVDCHFFYNRSNLEKCAESWGMSLDEVRSVSEKNTSDYSSSSSTSVFPCYEILREGDNFEIIPNDKWFKWAREHPKQNLVYDEEAIKHERDRRATIENALKTSTLFRNRTSTVADFEMCLSAANSLRKMEEVIREWHKGGTHN
jgi:hypothetical protein